MRVPGLARKFCTITSPTWPCSSPSALRASSASIRSVARLADPDQDPARERDRELSGEPDRLEPAGRHLVGRGPVRPALRRQPVGDGLEHDPHRGRHGPQERELVTAHHARVEVRQKPGLVEHELRAAREVLERRGAAERCELVTGDPVAELRLVAEREQRLRAAGGGTGTGDLEHLLLAHERSLPATRRPREGAVAADVAAEGGQRHEDLGRVRDHRARAQPSRLGHEVVQGRGEKLGDEVCHRRQVVAGRSPRAGRRQHTRTRRGTRHSGRLRSSGAPTRTGALPVALPRGTPGQAHQAQSRHGSPLRSTIAQPAVRRGSQPGSRLW